MKLVYCIHTHLEGDDLDAGSTWNSYGNALLV